MKHQIKKLLVALALASALPAQAQLIHGNTFEFWNVTGPLTAGSATITGNLVVGGTQTTTGVQTFTAAPVMSALTASLPVFTNGSKALVSNAMTGTGNVVMSTSPTLVTPTLGAALATSINGVTIPVTTGTVALLASPTFTGTVNIPILNITTTASPAAAEACTAGRLVWDADYIYVCTATGVWKRAALTGGY